MANIDAGSASGGAAPAPPGWYETELGQRYWDGGQWRSSGPPPSQHGVQQAPMGPGSLGNAPGYPVYAQMPHPSGISSDDRTMGMLAHILSLVASGIGPLAIYVAKGKESPFVRHHAAEALNLFLTVFVVSFGLLALLLGGVGLAALFSTGAAVAVGFVVYILLFVLIFAISIGALILTIMAGVAAHRGEWHRIPMIFHWVK